MIGNRHRPSRMRGLIVVAVAWATTAAVGMVIIAQARGSSPASASPARHTAMPGLGWNGSLYPLGPPGSGMAEKTTVADAHAKAGFPVPVPSSQAASRANLTQAWVSTHGRQVALVFDKGLVDITMGPAQYRTAITNFRAFIAEKKKNKVAAGIEVLNGQPALVITRNSSAICHCNPAYVEFDQNGIDINISSHTYGTDTLLAIARTMR
jgi:hypothetical protein